MTTIGIISDTHGYLDPKVCSIFAGVSHILHAGDIGMARIILELEEIAPVTAVLGNNDLGLSLRQTEVVVLEGRKFLVHHIVDIRRPDDTLRGRLERERPAVVVFGHTHKPCREQAGPTLFLNPGYAGKPRFNQPRSVAVVHCEPSGLRVEFHLLDADC